MRAQLVWKRDHVGDGAPSPVQTAQMYRAAAVTPVAIGSRVQDGREMFREEHYGASCGGPGCSRMLPDVWGTFFRPSGAGTFPASAPTARAVGCILLPLRG